MDKTVALFAGRGLMRRPLHTGLLLFAITVALAGTLTTMAVLSGLPAQMRRDLAQVGLDVINVHVAPSMQNLLLSPLKVEDLDEYATHGGDLVAPFQALMGLGEVESVEERVPFLVLNTTADWGRIVPVAVTAGRFFEDGEDDACVLDEWVASQFFPDGDAIGRKVQLLVGGTQSERTVVGVLKDPFEIRKRFDELDVTGSARSRMLRMMEFKSVYVPRTFDQPKERIHGGLIHCREDLDPVEVATSIQRELGDRSESVWVWARREWVDAILGAADLGVSIANVVWLIMLLVTGVMILSVSLVAVQERFTEIAIRRTEGATKPAILWQMFLENAMLTGLASAMAVPLARWFGELVAERYLSWPPSFEVLDVSLALGLGFVMGAAATLVPALRAASVDPVDVLRVG